MNNLDDFDKLTSAIQHVVTTIGIVVGGIWVLVTFWGQHVIQKANLDVAKTEKEIRKIEQDSLEQPVLRTTIITGPATDDGYPASIMVTFRNEGKLALNFQDPELRLMQLTSGKALEAEKGQPIRLGANILEDDGTLSRMPARILRASQERSLAFVLPKLAAGRYFVEVRADYDGLKIIDGKFQPSMDEMITAIDQFVLSVPIKQESKTSAVALPKE